MRHNCRILGNEVGPSKGNAGPRVYFIASCSFHVGPADFAEAVRRGLADAGRAGRILRVASADADHPIHPALPETAYLKTLTLALD